MRKKTKKRVIVHGIEHGYTGYTTHRCRCDVCRQANTDHAREYRDQKFAGSPLCIRPNCPRNASRAYSSGLCYKHQQQLKEIQRENPAKAQRIAKRLGVVLAG